jgi:hypothetical protein
MVTYEFIKPTLHAVFLHDGRKMKRVGKIEKTHLGWQYFPKGSRIVGEPFDTLEECKQSLEED